MNKKIVIGVLALVVVISGFLVYDQFIKPLIQNRTVTTIVPMKISNDDLSFSFTYPSGEEGYTLIEPPIATSTSDLLDAYIIMNTSSYLEFQSSEEAREAPPTITIFVAPAPSSDVVEGDRTERLLAWATNNPQFSSFSTKTSEVEIVEMDGTQAIAYKADGLYQQTIYIAYYRGNAYAFIGQYDSETDDIYNTFFELIYSVAFD